MPTKNQIFASQIKYDGILDFGEFYKFCYDYLTSELGFDVIEDMYKEKVKADEKELNIKWNGTKRIDDYFKYNIKIEFRVFQLKKIEIEQSGKKKKTNKGLVELKLKGIIESDYRGQYETKPFLRFIRNVYEKWIIPSKIEVKEGTLIGSCDEFLGQAKAFLDLEGKDKAQIGTIKEE